MTKKINKFKIYPLTKKIASFTLAGSIAITGLSACSSENNNIKVDLIERDSTIEEHIYNNIDNIVEITKDSNYYYIKEAIYKTKPVYDSNNLVIYYSQEFVEYEDYSLSIEKAEESNVKNLLDAKINSIQKIK